MMKHLNRKFSGFLILALTLSALSVTAKNRWQSRMEKEPQSNRPSETTVSSVPTGTVVTGKESANCMNVKVRVTTNILSEAGTISEVPVEEMRNNTSASFACTSFRPALHGDGQPVTAGNVSVTCADGVLKVTSANCALQPRDCGAQTMALPAGIQAGTAAANIATPAIVHGGSTTVACTGASPGLVMDGKAVDRGTITVACNNGTTYYAGANSCSPPPPCPAGYCYAQCNSWCSDGTSSTSWEEFTTINNGGGTKSGCTRYGKENLRCKTVKASTFHSCQNGQYYRKIDIVSTYSGSKATGSGWACSSSYK